jgi:hypothetical protein
LDAFAAVLLDGLSYRRAGRMVGISKTEVGDSLDLLLGELAAVGLCQPDGTFVTTLDDLRELLVEMAAAGEAVVVDGLATRVQRPREWGNQKVLYDAKRHAHTAQGLSVSTTWGDLLWLDGGWPGSCHEQELLELSGLERVLDGVGVASLLDRGFRGLAQTREHWHAPVGDRRTRDRLSDAQWAYNACRRGCAAGGAGDRPSGRRLGVAPLARPAVPRPRCLPRRRRAGLPRPLAAPGPRMTKSITETLNHLGAPQDRLPLAKRVVCPRSDRAAKLRPSAPERPRSRWPSRLGCRRPGRRRNRLLDEAVVQQQAGDYGTQRDIGPDRVAGEALDDRVQLGESRRDVKGRSGHDDQAQGVGVLDLAAEEEQDGQPQFRRAQHVPRRIGIPDGGEAHRPRDCLR